MASFAPPLPPTSSNAPRHAYFPTTSAPSTYLPSTSSFAPHSSGFPPTSAGAQPPLPLAHTQAQGQGPPYHPAQGEVGDLQDNAGGGGEYASYGAGPGIGSPPTPTSLDYVPSEPSHRGGGALPSRRIRDGGGGGGAGGVGVAGGIEVGAVGARIGVSAGKKEFLCDICGKAFQTGGYLARHKKVHTTDRPHACPIPGCPSRFNRHDNMLQHWRSHARRVGDIPGVPRPPAPRMVVDLTQVGLSESARGNVNLRPDMIVVDHTAAGRRMHAASGGGAGAGSGRGGGGGGYYAGGEYGAAVAQQQQQQQNYEQAQYAQAQAQPQGADFGYLNVPTYTGPPTYPGSVNGTTDAPRVGGSPVPQSEWSGSGYSTGSSGTAQSGGLVRTISAASGGSGGEGGQVYGVN
ncbi:hypothetical protein M427DRAFT_56667, partial [Gonapodya prolifera JEL478]